MCGKSTRLFVEPKDGAAIVNPTTVKFELEGMALKPAGDGHAEHRHHLIIDGGPAPKGEVIESSETSPHFGKGQTET